MMALIFTAIKCIAALVLIPLALGGSLFYLSEVNQRRAVHEADWEWAYSDMPNAKYFAKFAYLGNDNVLLQLYDVSGGRMSAERTFSYPEAIKLYWFEDYLLYDTNENSIIYNGTISLPPTWIDQLLTYLP